MLFVKTKKKDAEKIRRKCLELGILDSEYKVKSDENFVYFPIIKKIKGIGKIVELKGEKAKRRVNNIKEILREKLTEKEIEKIVTSYDLIGEIAVIEIPEELEKKEKLIADAIMEVHPGIKTVAKKYGAVSGEYRTRKIRIIAGNKTKETIHKEHGCRFKLNVEKAYYSVRLSGERGRIKGLVKEKERILALFSGVGPFPIIIAKEKPETEIVAIELNPIAVKYGKENLELNKIKNVRFILGDVNKIVPNKFRNWADRILMPLPKEGKKFLGSAIKGIKNNGIIHFYSFVDANDPFGEAEKIIEKECGKAKVGYKIISKRIVRTYSPKIVQVVADFRILK